MKGLQQIDLIDKTLSWWKEFNEFIVEEQMSGQQMSLCQYIESKKDPLDDKRASV